MEKLNIEQFNPTVAELQSMVQVSMAVDISNLKEVKEKRIGLQNVRVAITKKGKELREDAIVFQKAVITKEKELIAIIKPEENRLAGIEEEAQKAKEREERIALMPERKKRLTDIGSEYSDELIIGMDATEFQSFLNTRVAEKNEKERLENERKGRELKEAEDKLQRETETREREEKARQEERERAEQREKERVEREVREKREAEERADREKLEVQAKEREERERLEKEGKYKMWLATNGWTEETKSDFIFERVGNKIRLCKILAIYTIE